MASVQVRALCPGCRIRLAGVRSWLSSPVHTGWRCAVLSGSFRLLSVESKLKDLALKSGVDNRAFLVASGDECSACIRVPGLQCGELMFQCSLFVRRVLPFKLLAHRSDLAGGLLYDPL